jgi:hypothetical protein
MKKVVQKEDDDSRRRSLAKEEGYLIRTTNEFAKKVVCEEGCS